MNIYHSLNELITYIEQNLDQDISYSKLSKILGFNEYTTQIIFSSLCNISISDYIRKRRLSEAGFYLSTTNMKIIDIAIQYQYENPTSFSRAFEKFHGIKPSQVKNAPEKLKLFPKLHFDETITEENTRFEYSIIEQNELVLYGKKMDTICQGWSEAIPKFFKKMYKKYSPIYGDIDYGMTVYNDLQEARINSSGKNLYIEYWILYKKEISSFDKYIIPKSKWLCFRIPNENPNDIQKISKDFYSYFLPSCKYNIRPIPELEYYHDGVTDFLVPIED